jgi:arylformamidase
MAGLKTKRKKPISSRGWIDVSVPITDGMISWPGDPKVKIKRAYDIEKGDEANVTQLNMGAHTGTHMDAPCHFINSMPGVDKIPLDAGVGKVRVIGIKDKEMITPQELRNHRIRKGERILFKTVNSNSRWDLKPFNKKFVALSTEAARFLTERNIKTLGVDYLSIGSMQSDIVEVHMLILKAGIWAIEGLDLSKTEPGDYEMICLPLRIVKSDGSPVRALLRKL